MGNLRDLDVHKLQDLYDAEQQGLQAEGQTSGMVHNPQLWPGTERHLQQTREQPGGETCDPMKGLIAEGARRSWGRTWPPRSATPP